MSATMDALGPRSDRRCFMDPMLEPLKRDRYPYRLLLELVPLGFIQSLRLEATMAWVRLRHPRRDARFADATDLLVNLGSGDSGNSGWVNVDGRNLPGVTCVADLRRTIPLPDGSARAIFTSTSNTTSSPSSSRSASGCSSPAARCGSSFRTVGLSSSAFERFGRNIVEMLACGLPVVATPTGIAPEIVHPGCGTLVPYGDTTAAAGAVARWLNQGPVGAREAAAPFTWRQVGQAWEELLRAL